MSDEQDGLHRRTWELIPWVVNGRASAEARREVEAHVAQCADCRAELDLQQRIQLSLIETTDRETADATLALRGFWQRVDAADGGGAPRPRRRAHWLRLAVAALLIETIAVSALATALWLGDRTPAAYRTLSSTPAAPGAATLRAVFAPGLSQEATQTLLRGAGLRIVDGPSEAGVYSLAPMAEPPASTRDALALLRADPGVRFAEPLAEAAPR